MTAHPEHAEQAALVEYCRMRGWRVYAITNGAHLRGGYLQWNYLHAEGAVKGVPDLCIPYARGGYHGLYIEMKANDNKPTVEQTDWLDFLHGEGYLAIACWSADEAIAAAGEYMDGER